METILSPVLGGASSLVERICGDRSLQFLDAACAVDTKTGDTEESEKARRLSSLAICYEIFFFIDESKRVLKERRELVLACRKCAESNHSDAFQKAWVQTFNETNKRMQTAIRWRKGFNTKFQRDRKTVGAVLQRMLGEFTGNLNASIRTQFAEDENLGIWRLSDALQQMLVDRSGDFFVENDQRIAKEFFGKILDSIAKNLGRRFPALARIQVVEPTEKGTLREESAIDKIRAVNRHLRMTEYDWAVMGGGAVGRLVGIGKAPRSVREQFFQQNQMTVGAWLRQFNVNVAHEFNQDCDLFESYINAQLDTLIACYGSRLGFMTKSCFHRHMKPVVLDIAAISNGYSKRRFDEDMERVASVGKECFDALSTLTKELRPQDSE